ncbi:MAG: hypothetical protein FWH06_00935 [Oscillospiraceae bacterium]|nr:hypothetical protein [Oscillospiraceae bacterium]
MQCPYYKRVYVDSRDDTQHARYEHYCSKRAEPKMILVSYGNSKKDHGITPADSVAGVMPALHIYNVCQRNPNGCGVTF